MAGLTIDGFPVLPSPLVDDDWAPIGRGSSLATTYHVTASDIQKYIQKRSDSSPNNMNGQALTLVNGSFVVTSTGGAITVFLRTFAGADPSVDDPVFVTFRNATLTNGSYVIRKITAATTFTINAGATLGAVTNAPLEVLILGINDTSFQLGLVNPKMANGTYYVPDEYTLKSTTGGNGANNPGIIYSSTSAIAKPIVILGFLRWNSGLSSPGTWTLPTAIQQLSPSTSLARIHEVANDLLTRDALLAPLASPAFTGTPVAPTPLGGTNNTQIATTAYFIGQGSTTTPLIDGVGVSGVSLKWSREDHVHPTDTTRAPVTSPTFSGTPTTPTAPQDSNTTQVANTAFIAGQAATTTPSMDGAAAVGTSIRFSRADHVHPSDTSRAPLVSPVFTGTPSVPTAPIGTNTTQAASCAFVLANAGTGGAPLSSSTPLMDGAAAVGTATTAAHGDHVHPTDTSRAPVASPTFSGTITFPLANWQFAASGSNPVMYWDSTDYQSYDRTTNAFYWYSGNTQRLSLDASGNLIASGDITAFSDPLLKSNPTPLGGADAIVNGITAYNFNWNTNASFLGKTDGQPDIGFLSSEVKAVYPQAVQSVPNGQGQNYETVAYQKLTVILHAAVKGQGGAIAALEATVDEQSTALEETASSTGDLNDTVTSQAQTISDQADQIDELTTRCNTLTTRCNNFEARISALENPTP